MKEALRISAVALLAFTALCGLVYPALVYGVGQVAFPHRANGSLIRDGDRVVGSELIGQAFSDRGHFWGRRSSVDYAATTSGGANLGPSNPALAEATQARIAELRAADPGNAAPIPADLVTASASGLDPHISPGAADYQVPRVARARGLAPEQVRALVERFTEPRTLGILGDPRVNVLLLNRALDAEHPAAR